jgi:hypothetical protein
MGVLESIRLDRKFRIFNLLTHHLSKPKSVSPLNIKVKARKRWSPGLPVTGVQSLIPGPISRVQ